MSLATIHKFAMFLFALGCAMIGTALLSPAGHTAREGNVAVDDVSLRRLTGASDGMQCAFKDKSCANREIIPPGFFTTDCEDAGHPCAPDRTKVAHVDRCKNGQYDRWTCEGEATDPMCNNVAYSKDCGIVQQSTALTYVCIGGVCHISTTDSNWTDLDLSCGTNYSCATIP